MPLLIKQPLQILYLRLILISRFYSGQRESTTRLIVRINKSSLEKRLKENGEVVYANYSETILNTMYKVNGKSPYIIICEWVNPVDNKRYIFKSKNIWIYPNNIIEEKNIKQFPVYIDKENKNKYFVDVDFLTEDVVDLR